MKVLRWDKQAEPRRDEIRADWRLWAEQNGYKRLRSVPLSVGELSITFEVFKHEDEDQKDAYLLYHPRIGGAKNTKSLSIFPDADTLESALESSRQMARRLMAVIQQQ